LPEEETFAADNDLCQTKKLLQPSTIFAEEETFAAVNDLCRRRNFCSRQRSLQKKKLAAVRSLQKKKLCSRQRSLPEEEISSTATALPLGVRRWLCLAVSGTSTTGFALGSGCALEVSP
jgi:hypothetical protein